MTSTAMRRDDSGHTLGEHRRQKHGEVAGHLRDGRTNRTREDAGGGSVTAGQMWRSSKL